jgi:rubrerythrin
LIRELRIFLFNYYKPKLKVMKTLAKLIMLSFTAVILYSCASKPLKTIEDLKAAYNGESTASAKYAAFAEKAKQEGFDTVAVMFLATSKAESVHAGNHKKVLEKLGVKIEGPEIGKFEIKTTAENIDDALKGETYEVETMYPGFIKDAEGEKVPDAVKSFTWAIDTEKKHQVFYKNALEALNSGGEKTLPAVWFVCPVCGNTYDGATVAKVCDFCMTPKEKFIQF